MEVDVNTTVEIDTDELYREIEDGVQECAESVARNLMQDWDFSDYIDYNEGARSLLWDYNPDSSCSLAELFTEKVQAAVGHGDFLAEAVKAAVGTTDGVPAVNPEELRKIVREEIREALRAARMAMDISVV